MVYSAVYNRPFSRGLPYVYLAISHFPGVGICACHLCRSVGDRIGGFIQEANLAYINTTQKHLSHLSKNLVRVSQKLVLSDRGTAHLVRELGKEHEDVREIISLREIDCIGKKSRILGLIYCSENGVVIKRESS